MSWNAYLFTPDLDGNWHLVRDWNYTHNCNGMAAKVLQTHGHELPHAWFDGDRPGTQWWKLLDGIGAKESLALLDLIIGGLREAPVLFREMNPDNGWGDFDSFLALLVEMRDGAAEYPSASWETNG